MTMGLVVIMIVLIGVMGAGLLTFVQRDLENVVEVNRGQKAIEVSDAGVQAARRQLLVNSFPNQYNDPTATPLSPEATNSPWAYNTGSATCGSLSAGPGRCITTPEGDVRVTIKYLPPPPTAADRTNANFAPEALPSGASDYKDKRDYFQIETDGVFSGARRKIQAILVTEDLNLPKAYFATDDIELAGGLTVTDVSLFARGDITGIKCGTVTGIDKAYGDWFSATNDKSRIDSTRTSAVDPGAAGLGAEGEIDYASGGPGCSGFNNNDQKQAPAEADDLYKKRDFDGLTSFPGGLSAPSPNYRFCAKNTACWPSGTAQPAGVITYPFDGGANLNADFLRSVAEQQVRTGAGPVTSRDNYIEQPGSGPTVDVNASTFNQQAPALSSVMVVKFTGSSRGTVDIVSPAGGPCLSGTVLVINGDVNTSNAGAACFDGVLAIQRDPTNPLAATLTYKNTGDFTLNGFANIDGKMQIRGGVGPILTDDVLNQPGYHDVKTWSWRECYKEACN